MKIKAPFRKKKLLKASQREREKLFLGQAVIFLFLIKL